MLSTIRKLKLVEYNVEFLSILWIFPQNMNKFNANKIRMFLKGVHHNQSFEQRLENLVSGHKPPDKTPQRKLMNTKFILHK